MEDEESSQQDEEEYLPLTEQTAKMSTGDDEQIKLKGTRRRRSRFRFSFTNPTTDTEDVQPSPKRKSRLARTLSASILNEQQQTKGSSRRRKSYSSSGLATDLEQVRLIFSRPSFLAEDRLLSFRNLWRINPPWPHEWNALSFVLIIR